MKVMSNAQSVNLRGFSNIAAASLKPGENTTIYYGGSYEFTPTDTTQTILINGMTARENIIINPIPSNYGLVTWNGSTLTIS